MTSLSVYLCSTRKPRKSFVGHPDTILFLRISEEGVFQQPRLLTTVIDDSTSGTWLTICNYMIFDQWTVWKRAFIVNALGAVGVGLGFASSESKLSPKAGPSRVLPMKIASRTPSQPVGQTVSH